MLRRFAPWLAVGVLGAGLAAAPSHLVSRTATAPDFVHFEAGHVHPLALTPSGVRLLVLNTPDARLSVFDATADTLAPVAEVPVGLEPVAVAAYDDSTAWVVNWLSDDVSIVNLNTMQVRATLRVGDEPMDVLFAGTPLKAYVSVSQEDVVKVYDPATLTLESTIPVPGHLPRTLARTADGSKVYVAIFDGGNKTTVLTPEETGDSLDVENDVDFPRDPGNKLGHSAPHVGAVVEYVGFGPYGAGWYDINGKLWNSTLRYRPADNDVVEISTASDAVTRSFFATGSTNYSIAVSPLDGRIAVANTDGRGRLTFEPRVSGYVVETQTNFITQAGALAKRVLNPQVDYSVTPGPQSEADSAIGIPTAVAFAANGSRAYVTGMGTHNIGVLNPTGGLSTTVRARIQTVAGPSGLLVDDAHSRIFVLGRFHNQIQTLSTANFSQKDVRRIGFDPTPDVIVNGRRVFYGGFTSGHGEQACADCHVFGDEDGLAWDLGNPLAAFLPGDAPLHGFDPQKGPMVTQSLRGMTNTEPLHWRGDRANFNAFNGAIVGLLGRGSQLADSEMTAMGDFAMPLVYPPNPHEYLDRSLPDAPPGEPSAVRGQQLFENALLDTASGTPVACASCHVTTGFAPGTNRTMIPREQIFDAQDLKVPQLRNLYRKVGFSRGIGDTPKRLFGYSHNGSHADITDFLARPEFAFDPDTSVSNPQRRDIKAYLLAFDTGMAPAVGYQLTFGETPDPVSLARLDTLRARAEAGDCDLIAHGRVGGVAYSWLYRTGGVWGGDVQYDTLWTTAGVLGTGGLGTELTVTGVPPGTGIRMGLDRDRDGYYDGDEIALGSLPDDPNSVPGGVGVPGGPARETFGLRMVMPNPFRDRAEVVFALATAAPVDLVVYDILGRETRVLAHGQTFPAGTHRVLWDGRRGDGGAAAPGVYFIRYRSAGSHAVRPIVRIR